MDDRETWALIPSLPEYMASSHGRVMRMPHFAPVPRGQGQKRYGGTPWLGVWESGQGRYIIMYRKRTYRVARLICEAFHGPSPFEGAVVMHLDEDSRNNRPANLKWGTQRENLNAPGFISYCRSRVGDASPTKKGKAKLAAAVV